MFSQAQEQTGMERMWQKSSVERTEVALEDDSWKFFLSPSVSSTVGEEAKWETWERPHKETASFQWSSLENWSCFLKYRL